METRNIFFETKNAKRFFYFAIIGSLGAMLNTLVFFGLNTIGMNYLLAAAIATEAAIISNFIGNSIFTFSDIDNTSSLGKRFVSFQAISLITLVGTLSILWMLTQNYGKSNLVAWNLIAIISMFIANFILNLLFTWGTIWSEYKTTKSKKIHNRKGVANNSSFSFLKKVLRLNIIGFGALFFIFSMTSAYAADILATSQLGYHPDSSKKVILYSENSQSGSFEIVNSQTNQIALGNLVLDKEKNFDGTSNVECQGGKKCIVGDFSGFAEQGTFYIRDSNGLRTLDFDINSNIFSDNVDLFLEFFDAQKQQGSSYHANMHSIYSIPLSFIADGSFIIEADQAALTLIRLGSAYRRNPQLFAGTSLEEQISLYVEYLKNLQGVSVTSSNGPDAVRLGSTMKIEAFTPGPVPLGMETIDVYAPGNPPTLVQSATAVTSFCGSDDGSSKWNECIGNAALYYKCQFNEPCLKLSYIGDKGVPSRNVNSNGYGVSKGWGYEFGCYFDVDIQNGNFNDGPNPCNIFYPQHNRNYTVMTLLGFLQAYPALNDNSLKERAIDTYSYIKSSYPSYFSNNDVGVGFWGASLFLLYDYTGDANYLQEAYDLKEIVSIVLTSDATKGNEFYWEEFIRHKDDIIANSLDYPQGTSAPEEYFRGQMYHDYKDQGIAMSKNAERVFEVYRNTNFQNSRQMLTMGLLGAKTLELRPGSESWIKTIPDSQLAWLTGMNAVQKGTSISSPLGSVSFIFGIGNHPSEFHSRYLVNSGYSEESSGEFVGVRGTNYVFKEPGTNNPIGFDGYTSILGENLGARGNKWQGEDDINDNELYRLGTEFKNGLDYIPGWINGAFDTTSDTDVFFNYNDNLDAYEYTETTNEMVATAIELFAYLDGQMNNKPRYDGTIIPINTTTNNTTPGVATLSVISNPTQSEVYINGEVLGTTDPILGSLTSVIPSGTHILTVGKTGYINYTEVFTVSNADLKTVSVALNPHVNSTNSTGSTLSVSSTPEEVNILLDSILIGTTDSTGLLAISGLNPGTYTLTAQKQGYSVDVQQVALIDGQTTSVSTTLSAANATGHIMASGVTGISMVSGSYYMREDRNATFFVRSNQPNTITWFVDGTEVLTTSLVNSTFYFNPGILFLPRAPDYSNIAMSTIRAVSSNESIEWNVNVENVVNPFFGGVDGGSDVIGSDSTRIHVFTNDKLGQFANVSVTIRSTESGSEVLLFIILKKAYQGNNETDWAKTLTNLPYGNIYLAVIKVQNNSAEVTYELSNERAHYRQVPFTPSGNNDDRPKNSNSGGSSSRSGLGKPQLVYATFAEDVILKNKTQTLTLDAKNFNGGVHKAYATIAPLSGEAIVVELDLISGTNEYGTWQANFGDFEKTGIHQLMFVTLGASAQAMTNISVGNRSFYVVDDSVDPNEKLMLVYSLLSHSTAKNGTNVTLKLDARDALGIEGASAKIKNSKGLGFEIPLKLAEGNKNYGTWQGSFALTQPDSTYSVESITLSNKDQSKTYLVKDRSVYVQWIPSSDQGSEVNPIRRFSKEHIAQLLKEPLIPTFVGFGLMLLVMGTFMITRGRKFGEKQDISLENR